MFAWITIMQFGMYYQGNPWYYKGAKQEPFFGKGFSAFKKAFYW